MHEVFNYEPEQNSELKIRYKLLNQYLPQEEITKNYKKHIEATNTKLKESGKCVAKFWPRNLIFAYDGSKIKNEDLFEYEIYLDFNKVLKIEEYDKIYFLDRPIIESAISYSFAKETDNFLFWDQGHLNYVKKKSKNKIIISEKTLYMTNFHIFESIIHHKLREFLIKTKIDFTYLGYDDCKDYVKNNLPSKKTSGYIETNFDYKEIIENYSDLLQIIEHKYNKFSEQLKDIEFI